jgi:hypothetical protein
MKKIMIRMSQDEMRGVLSLADDQIFRLKFIDRKIPGYKYDLHRFESGVLGVEVLRNALKEQQSRPAAFATFTTLRPTKH